VKRGLPEPYATEIERVFARSRELREHSRQVKELGAKQLSEANTLLNEARENLREIYALRESLEYLKSEE